MKPLAVLCADIHLSDTPPIARSVEKDWYACMERGLVELQEIAHQHSVPILCAGDIFHKWNSSARLINFALEHLPHMYAIPGQHDLPYHSMTHIQQSAYWTLVKAGKVKTLSAVPRLLTKMWVWGFPWGCDILPAITATHLRVAVIHAYIWRDKKGYPGAPVNKLASAYAPVLQGFDVALFGDNHKSFTTHTGGCVIWNNGGFFRRNIDEIKHRPRVGILMEDATVQCHYLTSCAEDQFIDYSTLDWKDGAMKAFVQEVTELEHNPLNFPEALTRAFTQYKVPPRVRKLILESIA